MQNVFFSGLYSPPHFHTVNLFILILFCLRSSRFHCPSRVLILRHSVNTAYHLNGPLFNKSRTDSFFKAYLVILYYCSFYFVSPCHSLHYSQVPQFRSLHRTPIIFLNCPGLTTFGKSWHIRGMKHRYPPSLTSSEVIKNPVS